MTMTPRTSAKSTAKKPANDNSTLTIVYGTGRLRNYIMQRANPEVEPRPEGDTGIVDMGKEGVFIGYAVLDPASNKYVFHKVKRIIVKEPDLKQG